MTQPLKIIRGSLLGLNPVPHRPLALVAWPCPALLAITTDGSIRAAAVGPVGEAVGLVVVVGYVLGSKRAALMDTRTGF